jgi:hypothetical protein
MKQFFRISNFQTLAYITYKIKLHLCKIYYITTSRKLSFIAVLPIKHSLK